MKNSTENKDANVEMQTAQEDRRIIRARQRAIGRELRRFFDGVAEEPVPDDFLDLLRQIEADGESLARKGS